MITTSHCSKSLVTKTNLLFLAFFLIVYIDLSLRPSTPAATSVVYTPENVVHSFPKSMKSRKLIKREIPSFMNEMIQGMKLGMINMEHEDISEWSSMAQEVIQIPFDRISPLLKWKHLFPEWIDEEEEMEGSSKCPEIQIPNLQNHTKFDLLVTKLPCKYPKPEWNRDVFKLQMNLIAAKIASVNGKRDHKGKVKIVFLSKCRPMLELFKCDDMVSRELDWWFFRPTATMLEEKMALPIGSCQLAMPLWEQGMFVYKLQCSWLLDP